MTLGIPCSLGTERATVTPRLVPTSSRPWQTSRLLTDTLWFPVKKKKEEAQNHLIGLITHTLNLVGNIEGNSYKIFRGLIYSVENELLDFTQMHHSDAHLCIVENQKRAQLMGHLNTVWCEGGREAGREAYLFHECRHFCSDNGYLSPGQRKRGAWIKAALFKCQSTEKYPIMVHFESNKQTQKRYVTEWVKRNAVIKQELCLCGTYKRTISPDLFPSVPVRKVPVMPLWTVNVVIVMLTAQGWP